MLCSVVLIRCYGWSTAVAFAMPIRGHSLFPSIYVVYIDFGGHKRIVCGRDFAVCVCFLIQKYTKLHSPCGVLMFSQHKRALNLSDVNIFDLD